MSSVLLMPLKLESFITNDETFVNQQNKTLVIKLSESNKS